jgi:3',5'-cyclic AMP phosphodiesterase CpdA
MSRRPPSCTRPSRRAFIENGTLVLVASLTVPASLLARHQPRPALRVGLVTDLHYADKPPAGSRHYRETPAKLAEAAQQFARETPDFIVELGDLIDAAESVDTEQRWLARINREFSAIAADRHYVLGNHCVDTLTKDEFLAGVEQPRSYYSFDRGGMHFIVLDACFRTDGEPYGRRNFTWTDANIPRAELDWLHADLTSTSAPVVVFAHQRLDVSTQHGVRNAVDVRAILERSGRVVAVLQGHSHQNDYREIGGIHYATLVAMVEGSGAGHSGYSLMDVQTDGSIVLRGFRRQTSYRWR